MFRDPPFVFLTIDLIHNRGHDGRITERCDVIVPPTVTESTTETRLLARLIFRGTGHIMGYVRHFNQSGIRLHGFVASYERLYRGGISHIHTMPEPFDH